MNNSKYKQSEVWSVDAPKSAGYYEITSRSNPKTESPYVAYYTGSRWHCHTAYLPESDTLVKHSPRDEERVSLLALLFEISGRMSAQSMHSFEEQI